MVTTFGFAIVTSGDMELTSIASQAVSAGYSRTDERGADKGGFELTQKAGLNPYSMFLTINKLDDLAKERGNPGYGVFNSHPEPKERLKRVMKQINALNITTEIVLNTDQTAAVNVGEWKLDRKRVV